MEDDMDLEAPLHAAAPAFAAVRLQPFWDCNPTAWFAVADGQFAVRGIADERIRFYNIIAFIPENFLRGLQDLLADPPADCYTQLKARMLRRHTLSRYERMEALWQVKPLNGQSPSALLDDLLQLCPPADRESELFRFCFLHRLPREVRILLANDADTPLALLAEQADRMVSHGGQSFAVAAVEQDPSPVAAVASRGRGGGRGRGKGRGGGRGGYQAAQQPAQQPTQQAAQPAERLEYQDGNELCFHHWTFGVRARKCTAPCTWRAGN
jgi:hypothetical protein